MRKDIITWIHLSDYHATRQDKIATTLTVDMLLEDIENRVDKLIRATNDSDVKKLNTIDLLLFTGNVAFGGQKYEYQRVWDNFFEPLKKTLNLKKERIFIVPGNHDLYRNVATSEIREELREKLNEGALELSEIEESLSNNEESFSLPFSKYKEFVKEKLGYLDVDDFGCFAHNFQINSTTISIVGTNTAWLSYEKDKIASVGLPFLLHHKDKLLLQKSNLSIFLMHHPLEMCKWPVNNEEFVQFSNYFKNKIDIIFCGHLHENSPPPGIDYNNKWLIIPGGAIISKDELKRFRYSYGIYFANEGKVKIYIREFGSSQKEFVAYTDSEHPMGIFEFSLPKKGKKREASTYEGKFEKEKRSYDSYKGIRHQLKYRKI